MSDANGYPSVDNLSDQTRNSLVFILEKNGDVLHSLDYMNVYKSNKSAHTSTQTYFFTDRAIYKPGQTVYFKGIVVDRTGDSVAVKSDLFNYS